MQGINPKILVDTNQNIVLDTYNRIYCTDISDYYYPTFIDYSFKAGDFDKSVGKALFWKNTAEKSRKTVSSFDYTQNRIYCTAHGLANADNLIFSTDDINSSLPLGLIRNKLYFIVNASTDYFQISETIGGAAVTFTSNGSGTNTFFPKNFYQTSYINQSEIKQHQLSNNLGIVIAPSEYYINGLSGYNNYIWSPVSVFIVAKNALASASILQRYTAAAITSTLTSYYTSATVWKNSVSVAQGAVANNENFIGYMDFGTAISYIDSIGGVGSTQQKNAEIYEIHIINRSLMQEERNYMFNLLSNKFNIPLGA